MGKEPLKRIEVVIESLQLKAALEIIDRSGATGYTVVPHVYGRGHRGMRSDLGFSDVLKNVMIIVVAPASVMEKIAGGLTPLLDKFTGFACITSTETIIGSHVI